MTRQLPWARQGNGSPDFSPRRGPRKTAGPRPSPTSQVLPSVFSNSAGTSSSSTLPVRKGQLRSSSPPTACPAEDFMIDGLEHDDRYRMVEDEFVQVAATFTAHLHAAEYQRLRRIAKSHNAETIRSISRPVTGAMTNRVRERTSKLHRISKQRAGLKRVLGATNDDADASDPEMELPWAGTSLHGLMDSGTKKPAARLSAVAPTVSHTRAAAGYRERSVHQQPASVPQHVPDETGVRWHSRSTAAPAGRGGREASDGDRETTTQYEEELSDGLETADFLRRARERRIREKTRRSLP